MLAFVLGFIVFVVFTLHIMCIFCDDTWNVRFVTNSKVFVMRNDAFRLNTLPYTINSVRRQAVCASIDRSAWPDIGSWITCGIRQLLVCYLVKPTQVRSSRVDSFSQVCAKFYRAVKGYAFNGFRFAAASSTVSNLAEVSLQEAVRIRLWKFDRVSCD